MAEQIREVDTAINTLSEIQSDITTPRNVRIKIDAVAATLKEDIELPMKVNKALNELGEIANIINIDSHTRIQIWNVISLLEKLCPIK